MCTYFKPEKTDVLLVARGGKKQKKSQKEKKGHAPRVARASAAIFAAHALISSGTSAPAEAAARMDFLAISRAFSASRYRRSASASGLSRGGVSGAVVCFAASAPKGTSPRASRSFISWLCVSMASCSVLKECPSCTASIHSSSGMPALRSPVGSGTITTYVVARSTSFSFTFFEAVPPGLHTETRSKPSSRCANCKPVMFTPAVQSRVTSSSSQVFKSSASS
mmetsp:Transcript_7303/g.31133  ORF Transcript_7303/g.31133 Transcript_7303/m.31133 type:complete len:223 (-) Transcript_7303:1131-1799(-)